MIGKAIADRFVTAAQQAGVSVSRAAMLGSYLHVDYALEDDTSRVLELLAVMKPSSVRRLPGGVDGSHLDGSKNHRIVAVFGGAA